MNFPSLITMHLLRQLPVPSVWMLCILFSCSTVRANENKTVLCVHDTEIFGWLDKNRFTVNDIDTNLCTHLVYYTGDINIHKRELIKISSGLKEGNGNENVIALKRRNPSLKVLINLELSNARKFRPADIDRNNDIAETVVFFLKQHKFDGIYLRFVSTSVLFDYIYIEIINTMKKAFQPHNYILALAVDQEYEAESDKGYDFDGLSRNLDFLILNAYNFYDSNSKANYHFADHHAPLYSRPWDTNRYKTGSFVVNHWINKDFPPEKILLGIPLWGNTWHLKLEKTNPPAPAKGPGSPGKHTHKYGVLGYFEICLGIQNEGWQVIHDPDKKMGPYAFSKEEYGDKRIWVGYDDPAMATVKSKYIISKGLGGAAVTDISYDDFKNKCGGGRNPMLLAIRKTLTPGWTTSSTTITTVLNPYLFSLVVGLLFSVFPLTNF